MNPKQLRKLARTDPKAFRRHIKGARAREMKARHLLLHQDLIPGSSEADLAALREYVQDGTWRSLYGHDRPMYLLLRAAVERLES